MVVNQWYFLCFVLHFVTIIIMVISFRYSMLWPVEELEGPPERNMSLTMGPMSYASIFDYLELV